MNLELEPAPALSSDLDWMLQSAQVSDAILIEALTTEFALPIGRLASLLLMEPFDVEEAMRETLVQALMNWHHYQPEIGARVWVYRLAVETCRQINQRWYSRCFLGFKRLSPKPPQVIAVHRIAQILRQMPERSRIALYLQYEAGLSIGESAGVLGINEADTHFEMKKATRILHVLLGYPTPHAEDWESGLVEQLQQPLQLLESFLEDRDEFERTVVKRAARQRTNRQFGVRAKEIVLGVVLIALVAMIGWMLSIKYPTQNPVKIMAVTGLVTRHADEVITRISTPTNPPPLLSVQSRVSEIRARIVQSSMSWQTLWADAWVVYFGPRGYIGPPRIYRNQVWLSQSGAQMVLYGPANSNPERLWLLDAVGVYEKDLATGLTYDYSSSIDLQQLPRPYVYETYADIISRMLFPADLAQGMIQPLRDELFAGRRTVVIQVDTDRLWVDAQSGIVLRWQVGNPVTNESFVTSIIYNPDIPDDFFSRRQIGWPSKFVEAQGQTALPRIEGFPRVNPKIELPAGFDRSQSHLSFQWPDLPPGSDLTNENVALVADGYLIGRVAFGDPWSLACKRSPDGQKIAWMSYAEYPPRLRWLRLAEPEIVHDPLPNNVDMGRDFAFSPDSQTLAFWSCGGTEENCGVYLHNLESGKNLKLIALPRADYFTWSAEAVTPETLSMIGIRQDGMKPETLVVQLNSGEVLTTTLLNLTNYPWMGLFYGMRGSLEDCVSP